MNAKMFETKFGKEVNHKYRYFTQFQQQIEIRQFMNSGYRTIKTDFFSSFFLIPY